VLSEDQLARASQALPFLKDAPEAHRREFATAVLAQRLPAGAVVFEEGAVCGAIAILFSGVARVFKIGENGREITLYRFSDGESCILTASCILGNHTFPAIAQIEREAEALLIPAPVYYEWMNRYAFWRDYTFALLSNRLAAVMSILDEVAFRRMDARVAELLLRRAASAGDVIRITHQEIAAELGTSREVVSRILEDLHARGALIAARGLITLADRQKLRAW